MEQTNALTEITDKNEAYKVIQDITFKDFDFGNDGRIDKEQFKDCLLANGIKMGPAALDEIFNEMDKNDNQTIDIREFEKFKSEKMMNDDEEKHHISAEKEKYYFKWNEERKEYQIWQSFEIDTELIESMNDDKRFKWMVYVPKIPPRKQKKFQSSHVGSKVNGYWRGIGQENKKMKNEVLSDYEELYEEHLDKIFAVLIHYYQMGLKDRENEISPLSMRNEETYNIFSKFRIFEEKRNEEKKK